MTRERSRRVIYLFEILEWREELIEIFYHGIRQKLIFTGALIHEQEVIVVDEPMVGLDPKNIRLVRGIFVWFCRRGRTVFMSTHTLSMVEETCTQLAIINHVRIIAEGTVDQLRQLSLSGYSNLEEIFLKLTQGEKETRIDLWGNG